MARQLSRNVIPNETLCLMKCCQSGYFGENFWKTKTNGY